MLEVRDLEIIRVADRAYVMETGKVRLSGTPAELSRDEAVVRTYLGG